ncbi:signal recognition particle receptor subunit beta [Patella vulgata]|uniref:signal recognition particle receptor subunit beta n=1 Tax=Patella vulgata TaxID=6465 RepID=UPI00217FCFF3|nr:signal recognition particle receptor subunit beta [Patella vulgata]
MANSNTMEEVLAYFTDGIETQDPTVIGILVGILVVFVSVVLMIIFGRSSNKRSGVLVLGICDAGKTLFFNRLVNGNYMQTYTSMTTNSNYFNIPNKNKRLRILDLPGYERIRGPNLDKNKSLARGIIYVVDSSTIQKEIKEVAGYLYTILSDGTISHNRPPVLIACNKQDLTLAKGSKVIRAQLEKEMNTLRVTRGAALQGQDNTSNNNSYLGKRNKDFEFSDLSPINVEFVECSCGKDDTSMVNLDEVKNWLESIA